MDIIRAHRGLFLFEGIAFCVLGILAIAVPTIFTFAVELLVGWVCIIAGITQAYRTFLTREAPGFWASLASAILYVIFGLLFLIYPIQGVITLTLIVTFFFVFEGLAKLVLAFNLRPFESGSWFILSGIISLLMAFIIWSGWPGTAFWVIGLLVGINMLFFGGALFALAWSQPKIEK